MGDADRILAGLNDEQLRAVTSDARTLVIRAGAGSGKTRVLTRRIAYRSVTDAIDARRVLALTFTRKAAGELNHRLRQLGLRQSAAAGTFHAIALAQLRQRWEERGERPLTLLERKVGFVARLLPSASDRATPLDVVSEIEWAKARRIKPESYADAARETNRITPLPYSTIGRIFEAYEDTKTKRGLIDFDDILILCGRTLQQDREAAAAFRWKFRHVFVDEFQDVNPLQFALLKMFVGDEPELCVVGDSRQAIYAWNGADSSYLDDFEQHFPGAAAVRLEHNYRSTPEILRCAAVVLPRQPSLVATRPSGRPPEIHQHADDRTEAKAIARQLRNVHSADRRWRDMAILARTNAQVVLLANACTDAGIPINARTDTRLLDRPEVQDALDVLHRAGPALEQALDELGTRLARSAAPAEASFDTDDTVDADDTAADPPSNGDDGATADQRTAVVESFLRLGRDHVALDPAATVDSFVAALRAGVNENDGAGGDAVDVTTFHAAKGLEWDIVHVAGMERGLSPIGHAKTPEALDEEHRLVYVALTRARRELSLHHAAQRTFGDRVSSRSPSPMLEVIGAAARGEDGRSLRAASARKAGAARSKLRASNGGSSELLVPADDPAFVALKDWRRSVAKANGVPAYIVFNDKTLQEIAFSRPTSEGALQGISGIGPVKAARYGSDVLAVLADLDA